MLNIKIVIMKKLGQEFEDVRHQKREELEKRIISSKEKGNRDLKELVESFTEGSVRVIYVSIEKDTIVLISSNHSQIFSLSEDIEKKTLKDLFGLCDYLVNEATYDYVKEFLKSKWS